MSTRDGVTDDLAELVAQLDGDDPDAAEEARYVLEQSGAAPPARVADLAHDVEPIGRAWHVEDVIEVIEELVAARQRITWLGCYTRNAGAYGWRVDTDVTWPRLDVAKPWPAVVAEGRELALEVVTHPKVPADAYARLSWIDERDA